MESWSLRARSKKIDLVLSTELTGLACGMARRVCSRSGVFEALREDAWLIGEEPGGGRNKVCRNGEPRWRSKLKSGKERRDLRIRKGGWIGLRLWRELGMGNMKNTVY